jgi:hypothetical protein
MEDRIYPAHRVGEVTVVNATPHEVTFLVGGEEIVVVPPSGATLKASPNDEVVGSVSGAELVRVAFRRSAEGDAELTAIRAQHPDALIIGSMISAQAYGFPVVALIAAPGEERLPPTQRRYRADRFTVFGDLPDAVRT